MLIYREDARTVALAGELHRLRRDVRALEGSRDANAADAALALLIEIGEFEAGVADALAPNRDAPSRAASLLRRATIGAARAWLDTRDGLDARGPFAGVAGSLDELTAIEALPTTVSLRVSEGYAYYALFPDTYVASARAFAAERRPRSVFCIGLRSVGTSLSAVVAAALAAQGVSLASCTVRPRGHPFDRRLIVRDDLATEWRQSASNGALFAVVDEGPGLSGSSLASVVLHLERIGVAPDRIAIFPAADPPAGRLRSSAAQHVWRTHRRHVADAAALGLTPERLFGCADVRDHSAGRWREELAHQPWPAVHPDHERWKVFAPGSGMLLKFVGLGRYGRAAAERAARLHARLLGPPPGQLRGGFLALTYVPGTPLPGAVVEDADAAIIGRHIAHVSAEFPATASTDPSALLHMIETNAGEGLGCAPSAVREAVGSLAPLVGDTPAAAIDGRVLAHEWIRTRDGLIKVDGLDHHRDHFFPGCQDPAWDVAAATIEVARNERTRAAVIDSYRRASGDRTIERRLPFFIAAYAAFRFGYCRMAAGTLAGSADGGRFARAAPRYASALAAGLRLPAQAIPSAP